MKKALFTGSGVALVTPFTKDGVDFDTLDKLIDFHLAQGTAAIIACGTTGEPSTMTKQEQQDVIRFSIEKVKGKIPVIAGTGGNNTQEVIEMGKWAKDQGADGQLCVTPYYNKTTQKGLIAHYTAIADSTQLPLIMYNVPARTGLNMLPETVATLAEHDNIVGLKEAGGDLNQIIQTLALAKGKIAFYSGSDEVLFPLLTMGYDGVISVIANVAPKEMQFLATSVAQGKSEEGLQAQFAMNPLIYALFAETSPAPVKEALEMMGYGNGFCRLPLVPLEEKNRTYLQQEMEKYGLL
ncbi:MAG: 4-hydroxy-tetrahydrodipicolinate synthase [Clostridiales bacterium]|nr:4-hydroxy-tetrahydrodipicolinate synthase [Clostridiales bacterium]